VISIKSWLCPIKAGSWKIIKREGVFGAPKRVHKIMKQVQVGDQLVFYVLTQRAIVAVYEVLSEIYEDYDNIWGRNRYPIRVKIKPIHDLSHRSEPFLLSSIFGGNSHNGVVVEPFLKNIWITPLQEIQKEKLKILICQSLNKDRKVTS
jgi:hypothetical protein